MIFFLVTFGPVLDRRTDRQKATPNSPPCLSTGQVQVLTWAICNRIKRNKAFYDVHKTIQSLLKETGCSVFLFCEGWKGLNIDMAVYLYMSMHIC